MGHSQIAAFARLANGNVKPTRTIFGQNTEITRNIHGFAYDPVKDEIVVTQFHSQAIMTYRGGANGDEAPIRTIHGPDVKIANTDKVTIDPLHRETYVPVIGSVMVFNSDADGNVAPIRVLKGPDTQIPPKGSLPPSVAVDPIHDLLFVGGGGPGGRLLIFNRTDSGNVKPRGFLRPPNNAGLGAPYLYPEGGLLFATVRPRDGNDARGAAEAAANPGLVGNENYNQYSEKSYVGVWSVQDTGETPPRWVIAAPPNGPLRDPVGTVVVDPKRQDVFIPDRYTNSIYIYHVPEIFK
jgi:hypothetical protein